MSSAIKQYLAQRNRGITLVLIALVVFIYLPSISNPLFFDDFNYLNTKFFEDFEKSFSVMNLRSIANLTLIWTWDAFNNFPHAYRLCNIIIHAINAVLVFHLSKAILQHFTNIQDEQSQAILAFIAAALFAANPIAAYAVGYIAQRGILLALMFVLAMQLAFLKAVNSNNIFWFVLTFVLYCLALLSKEHSIMAPLLLVAISIATYRKSDFPFKQSLYLFGAMGLIGTYIILKSKGVIGHAYEIDAPTLLNTAASARNDNEHLFNDHLFVRSIATQAGLFFKYFGLWLLPLTNYMAFDLREPLIDHLWSFSSIFSILAFTACLIISFWLLRLSKYSVLAFAIFSPAIMYFTEFSTIRVQEPFVLYRCYLWMPVVQLGVVSALFNLGTRRWILILSSMLLFGGMVVGAKEKLHIMSDHLLIWNESISHLKSDDTPGASRMYFNRGNAYLQNQKWVEAITDYEKVIQHDSLFAEPYIYIGIAYINLKNFEQAAFYLRKSLQLKPDTAESHFLLAIALSNLGMAEDASTEMKKSCNFGKSLACYFSREN